MATLKAIGLWPRQRRLAYGHAKSDRAHPLTYVIGIEYLNRIVIIFVPCSLFPVPCSLC
ncbi:hypothetical protein [Moorena producens]|uniref:hypothetical protein n=1 Tax=Moorena producens TaxID=1155739 RepID=UPI001314FD70|nr:hypothetical protein [Moorena producens]